MMPELQVIARSQYATCPGCGQTKHVDENGAMRVHNRYVPLRTSALIGRCAGTGQRPTQAGR